MNNHRVVGRTAFDAVKARHRRGARRISAEAVDGFGWEGDEAAGAQDFGRAADLGGHSLSGDALRTDSGCFARKSPSFFAIAASESASSAAAKSAAWPPPASPMAKVATGM